MISSRFFALISVSLSILGLAYWSLTAETWEDIEVAEQGYLQQKRLLNRLQ